MMIPSIDVPNELNIILDVGDHPYAICHQSNATQVAQQDIENLLLVLDPTNTISISREGDQTSGNYPTGWVMLLDEVTSVKRALAQLHQQFS